MTNSFQSPAAKMALRSGLYALRGALLEAANQGNTPNFRKAMRDWYKAADAYIAVVTTDHVFSCGSGCSACCFDNPQCVPAAEIALIADRVDDSMLEQLRDDVKAFEAISESVTDLEQRGIAFKREQRPCPLLGSDGRCRVYAERPLACRGFFSETPSDWCHPSHSRSEDAAMLGLEWPVAVIDLLQRISLCIDPTTPQDSLRASLLCLLEK